MNFWKKFFGKSNEINSAHKDVMVGLLKASYDVYGDEEIPIKNKILGNGNTGLKILKDISLDGNIDVNMRKQAIVYIAKFSGDEQCTFIAEKFVNGKIPAQLYSMYENGQDQASFPLFRQAKECLEQLGYNVG